MQDFRSGGAKIVSGGPGVWNTPPPTSCKVVRGGGDPGVLPQMTFEKLLLKNVFNASTESLKHDQNWFLRVLQFMFSSHLH